MKKLLILSTLLLSSPVFAQTVMGNVTIPGSAPTASLPTCTAAKAGGLIYDSTTDSIKYCSSTLAFIAAGGTSQWTTVGSDIYYTTGKVLVGDTSAAAYAGTRLDLYDSANSSSPPAVETIRRSTQGITTGGATAFGFPYLWVGGAEVKTAAPYLKQTIGFGRHNGTANEAPPCEMGMEMTSGSSGTSGDLVFACRIGTVTTTAATEWLRIVSTGMVQATTIMQAGTRMQSPVIGQYPADPTINGGVAQDVVFAAGTSAASIGQGGTATFTGGIGQAGNGAAGGVGGTNNVIGGLGGAGVSSLAPGAGGLTAVSGGPAGAGGNGNANGGNLTLEGGTKSGTGTAGTISIGATTASAITIGKSGTTTTITGPIVGGDTKTRGSVALSGASPGIATVTVLAGAICTANRVSTATATTPINVSVTSTTLTLTGGAADSATVMYHCF